LRGFWPGADFLAANSHAAKIIEEECVAAIPDWQPAERHEVSKRVRNSLRLWYRTLP